MPISPIRFRENGWWRRLLVSELPPLPDRETLHALPDGTYEYAEGMQVVVRSGSIKITDAKARAFLVHPGDIYDIISGNLFVANIANADERYECAKIISNVIEQRLELRRGEQP
jgi:hypothetical protein